MMNNDNSITAETILYGFIGEEAHSNRFSVTVNKLFKENGINAMVIPMNIRPDDVVFTISQMRSSKLSGAVISTEYQSEAFGLVDSSSLLAQEDEICDLIRIENQQLIGDVITHAALKKYADNEAFEDNVAMRSLCQYFYDLIRGENE